MKTYLLIWVSWIVPILLESRRPRGDSPPVAHNSSSDASVRLGLRGLRLRPRPELPPQLLDRLG